MFMDKMAPGILRLSVMDNDLDLFEGQYPVPQGVSYNSYLIEDDQLCLLDTVDARKQEEWLAGLDEVLAGRKLDYLVISHMEPDHAGSIAALCARQPQLKLVANARTFAILDQFSGDEPLAQERVTVADGGTLFIDEVGEVPLPMQTKLLRVLQEKCFMRVGGIREIRSDFRLVAATNRNISAMLSAGSFREDLYYRINTFVLEIPPLCELSLIHI